MKSDAVWLSGAISGNPLREVMTDDIIADTVNSKSIRSEYDELYHRLDFPGIIQVLKKAIRMFRVQREWDMRLECIMRFGYSSSPSLLDDYQTALRTLDE